MYRALELAKHIINQSIENHSPVTNLQVQNILYAVQKDCLKHDDIAFTDLFEAWYSGPVIPDVYYSLGIYGGTPILWEQEVKTEIGSATRERIRRAILENLEIPFFRQDSESYRKNSAWAKIWKDGAGKEQEIPVKMIQEEIDIENPSAYSEGVRINPF